MYYIDEYDYGSDEKTGSAWVKDDQASLEGFEVDAGIMLKFNKLLISAGATTINFSNIFWTAGIGISLK